MKKKLLALSYCFIASNFFGQTTFSCSNSSTVCACGGMGSVTANFYAGYFNDVQTYFTSNTPSITRNDANINYTTDNGWGAIVPPATGSLADPNAFSTRWSGAIYLAAGTYTFWLTSDDGSWLWLGANALATNPTSASAFINNGGLHSPTTVSAVGIFTANCLQDFRVHFGENTGNNRCYLEYACTALGIARQAIPSNAFCRCQSTGILPIELSEFYAMANKDNVMLYWNTVSEKNNFCFNTYKSADGISWTPLGMLPGAGSSKNPRSYNMADHEPLPGVNYYLLTQTDFDGTVKKFKIIMMDFSDNNNYIKLYPNPFLDKFIISSSTAWQPGDLITIYDELGMEKSVPMNRLDKYSVELNTTDLPKGNYIIKIQSSYQVIVKKMVKDQ